MESQKFINIKTGEIVTQVPLLQIADYKKLSDYQKECLHPEAKMHRSNTGGQCGYCKQLFGSWADEN